MSLSFGGTSTTPPLKAIAKAIAVAVGYPL